MMNFAVGCWSTSSYTMPVSLWSIVGAIFLDLIVLLVLAGVSRHVARTASPRV